MRQCRWSNDALLPPESVTPVNLEPIVMTPGAFSPVNLSSLHSHGIKDIYAFASRHCPQSGSCWLLAVKEVCLSDSSHSCLFRDTTRKLPARQVKKKMPCAFSSPRNTCSLFSPLFSLFSCLALLLAISLGNFTCKLWIQQVTLVFCTLRHPPTSDEHPTASWVLSFSYIFTDKALKGDYDELKILLLHLIFVFN